MAKRGAVTRKTYLTTYTTVGARKPGRPCSRPREGHGALPPTRRGRLFGDSHTLRAGIPGMLARTSAAATVLE